MTALAPDAVRVRAGLAYAVLSAASFGLSGSLASGLLVTGWSPGAVVLVRVGLAALVLLPAGVRASLGRWHVVRRNAPSLLVYGLLAVAGAQVCYFSAIRHMEVGPALLVEYTSPAAVVAWLWLRHRQPPRALTVVGGAIAAAGLLLVLDLVGGASVSAAGVAWALGAMVGAAVYFLLSADATTGLPGIALAAWGLMVAAVALVVLGAVGVLPMHAGGARPTYDGRQVPVWVPLALLGSVTAALAYATGIAAGRRLGSRLASFVALLEVLAAVGWAVLLLRQTPSTLQAVGGAVVLVGVIAVKLGEDAGGEPRETREQRLP